MNRQGTRAGQAGGWRRWLPAALAALMMASLLAACSSGGSGGSDGNGEPRNRVLRIGTLYGSASDESWFRQQYTDSFELLNPDIEIQIVSAIDWNKQRFATGEEQQQPDPYEELKKMLTGDNPVDVLIIDYAYLRRLIEDNLLQQLDPLIQKDNFDLEDFVPAVLEGIRALGDNNLYALAPTFSSNALFYNKRLFEQYGVTPPTDNMYWSDVLNLAKLIARGEGSERVFGIQFNRWFGDPYYEMQSTYTPPLQLRMYDNNGEHMTVNTPVWERVWTTMADLYMNDIVPTYEDVGNVWEVKEGETPNPFAGDLFIMGRVAMMTADYGYINELQAAAEYASTRSDFEAPDWDVVTLPQHEEAPGIGSNTYLNSITTINAKAQNPDDAWRYVKFINGRDWAKLKSRSMHELSARKEFLKPPAGLDFNIGAFTLLRPVPPANVDYEKLYREHPNLWQVENIGRNKFQEVIENKKSVKEALAEWETEGNAVLQNKGESGGEIGIGPVIPYGGRLESEVIVVD
ncbi:MAG: ABC transporter substrate-binding protein [Thermobacillus sp. ZCTH02-B1]|uniref:ABC transporter substrate-binding protein n=1 Tax=Thermobacillus sp. ZCTH02-B1 TaxID=1858795 RepID=UPI000B57DC7F|nr:extracellular solute-binding protein [Thermobacillus sp. ZCTH02-B1]OUM95887.1 MAG: ABC transporter substrate-binding protein [Thermobacillus sp. ZCTH02-B1]